MRDVHGATRRRSTMNKLRKTYANTTNGRNQTIPDAAPVEVPYVCVYVSVIFVVRTKVPKDEEPFSSGDEGSSSSDDEEHVLPEDEEQIPSEDEQHRIQETGGERFSLDPQQYINCDLFPDEGDSSSDDEQQLPPVPSSSGIQPPLNRPQTFNCHLCPTSFLNANALIRVILGFSCEPSLCFVANLFLNSIQIYPTVLLVNIVKANAYLYSPVSSTCKW